MRGGFAVSLHDVAPTTWSACERLLALTDALRLPVTLLVVPHFHGGTRADLDPGFVRVLRDRVARGDETVLHGYFREDRGGRARSPGDWFARRLYTDSEGEFAALDADAATDLVARGRAVFAAAGLAPAGFVAPAWLMSEASVAVLGASGLRYAATRDALIDLPSGRRIAAPSLVYSTRARWRRNLSRAWNAARLATLDGAPRIRAALHPADAGHAAVLADWERLLGRLARERHGVLESSWLGATG